MITRVLLVLLLCWQTTCLAAEPSIAIDSAMEEELLTIEGSPTMNNVKTNTNNEKVFSKAANFYAIKSTGEWTSLNAYEGNIVVLTFWTTYDRYCLKSIKPLNDMQKKYKRKGVEILAVAIDNSTVVREFLDKNPDIKYTVLFGSTNLAKEYDVWGLPTTYILDKNLSIRKVFNGYLDQKSLEKELKKLL